ncbi:MAG TPA: response regulator [Pseudomonadales bacterium]|nr:response regulator [Pseudomonadales bacterium]
MTDRPRVIVVEDEPITRAQLAAHLEEAGFDVQTRADGSGLEDLVLASGAELVLLDIKLPGADGLTLTRAVRASSDVGIILVTSRQEQIDRIVGLESGADDYVTKPFDPRELVSRARNLQRRVQAQRQQLRRQQQCRFVGWILDLGRRELTDPEGQSIHLSAGEFQLLATFVEHAGEILTRDRIMNLIRNREWYPDDRYIDVLVGQLRRKLGETASTASIITTIHGTGYLFAPDVT